MNYQYNNFCEILRCVEFVTHIINEGLSKLFLQKKFSKRNENRRSLFERTAGTLKSQNSIPLPGVFTLQFISIILSTVL